MATPTLGNTPTYIHYCETDDWTSSDGTDGEIKKQGTYSIAWICRGTATDETQWDRGTGIDMTGQHFRVWINHAAIPYLDPVSGGGMEVGLSSDNSNWAYWTLFGSDTYEGGWFNGIVDCDSSPDSGSYTKTSVRYFKIRGNVISGAANKINTWYDYLRYGDGYYATGGTSGDEITLAGILAQDAANGYGMLLAVEGVYFGYGELQLGNGATTTWFKMDGEVLVFTDSPVATGLFAVRGEGSGCRVNIANSVIRSAGTGDANRFGLDMDDTNLVSCSITGSFLVRAGASAFKSGQTITSNVFLDCSQIAAGGADFTGTVVSGYEGTTATAAMLYDVNADPDGELDDMEFTKGTATTHAIELGTNCPSSITLRGWTTSGYNASNGQNDSTIYNNSGKSVTISVVNGSGNFTYRNGSGASTTMSIDPRTVTVTALTTGGTEIQNANVFLRTKTGGTGPFPENDTVTIVNSGTTATVTHTSHGMATNDYVLISGSEYDENNGVFQITVNGVDEYEYTMTSTPSGSPSATIKCWFVFLKGLTDVNGEISMSRVISSDQDVEGWARKSTSSPYYKQGDISGVVSSSGDTDFTAVMASDE